MVWVDSKENEFDVDEDESIFPQIMKGLKEKMVGFKNWKKKTQNKKVVSYAAKEENSWNFFS